MATEKTRFKAYCAHCNNTKPMKCVGSSVLSYGIKSANYRCGICEKKWLYHDQKMIRESTPGLSGISSLNKDILCKCLGKMVVIRSMDRNGNRIHTYQCNQCNERHLYINGKFERKIIAKLRKGKNSEIMPGARFIAGRSQSGSK